MDHHLWDEIVGYGWLWMVMDGYVVMDYKPRTIRGMHILVKW